MAFISQIPLGLSEVLLANLVIFIGVVVQSSLGMGLGLVAIPVLVFINLAFVPGPIIFLTLLTCTWVMLRERKGIDFKGISLALAGRFVCTLPAAYVLTILPESGLKVLFGAMVIAAALVSMTGIKLKQTRVVMIVAGAISGIMSTIASIGGPVMGLVYQHESGFRLRGTLSFFFLAGSIVSLGALWMVGKFGQVELLVSLVVLPGLVLGCLVSPWVSRFLDTGYSRPAILILSLAGGVYVILRQVF